MEERLIAKYLGESKILVFGKILDSNKLLVRLMNNEKIIGMFKLITWQGGTFRRIYIHERVFSYRQLGYIEISSNNQFTFIFNDTNILNWTTKRVIQDFVERLYHDNAWKLASILPIEIKNTEPDINTDIQKKTPNSHSLQHKDIGKSAISKFQSNTNLQAKPKESILDKSSHSIENIVEKDICESCRYRKICFERYQRKNKCNDYEIGAAIMSDISQFDSRY